jgi:hypothetical protein
MIGKIIKSKSFEVCVKYVLSKNNAEILTSKGVLETDKESIINSFYMQSLMNPRLSKSVGHIPLAFSAEDAPRLTDNFITQLAKEYMQLMKIENTQYLIVRHNDTAHPHCHIVFNRVDNNGKTISDKNDHFRNEKVCKLLKDKYNLTYGKGKEKVNVQNLKGAEKTKYQIYHAVNDALPRAKSWRQLEEILNQQKIEIAYKYKGQTGEIQGISFKKGEHSFRGSEIDRKFSYSKIDAILNENNIAIEQHAFPRETENTFLEKATSTTTEIISGVSSLLDFQPSNEHPDDAIYPPRRKIKKKKRKGFGL